MEPGAPLDHLTDVMGTSASLAAMLVLSLACAVAAAIALVLASRSGREARDAQRAIDGAGRLEEGGTLVFGFAETSDGEPAVTVRLFERGREWQHKGVWHHEWKETSREVRARPFHVVNDGKERVLVEPSDDVFLVDEMEVSARRGPLLRERTAALTQGEQVAVTGRLRRRHAAGGAYRGSGGGWVLEPPQRGPMILATQPLASRHRSWARFYTWVALAPLTLLLVSNLIAYSEFYTFVLHGRPVVGNILERDIYVTYERHGPREHYRILVGLEDGQTWMPVSDDGYLRATPGSYVVAIETPDHRLSLGSEPGIPLVVLMFPLGAAVLAGLFVWFLRRRRLLWWEQRPVVTTGPGSLSV